MRIKDNLEDVNKKSIKKLKKEYDLIRCSAIFWEKLHGGKGIQLPMRMWDSYDDEKIETRCIHCGCSVFEYKLNTINRCTLDDKGNALDTGVTKTHKGLYKCVGCDNIIHK